MASTNGNSDGRGLLLAKIMRGPGELPIESIVEILVRAKKDILDGGAADYKEVHLEALLQYADTGLAACKDSGDAMTKAHLHGISGLVSMTLGALKRGADRFNCLSEALAEYLACVGLQGDVERLMPYMGHDTLRYFAMMHGMVARVAKDMFKCGPRPHYQDNFERVALLERETSQSVSLLERAEVQGTWEYAHACSDAADAKLILSRLLCKASTCYEARDLYIIVLEHSGLSKSDLADYVIISDAHHQLGLMEMELGHQYRQASVRSCWPESARRCLLKSASHLSEAVVHFREEAQIWEDRYVRSKAGSKADIDRYNALGNLGDAAHELESIYRQLNIFADEDTNGWRVALEANQDYFKTHPGSFPRDTTLRKEWLAKD